MSVTTSTTNSTSLEMRHSEAVAAEKRAYQARATRLKVTERLLTIIPPLVLALVILISWYISAESGAVHALFLPKPGDVLISLRDGIVSGIYLGNTLVTVQESILGFLLAVAIALPLGYGLVKSRLLAAAIHPYLAAGQAIPAIVIAPLLIIWLGYGQLPNIVVCMLVVFFPLVVNTILGLQTIDKALTDAARVEGAFAWTLLAHIEFPLALPSILAGIRTGLILSVTGALVAEFVQGGDQGLGSLLLLAKNQMNTPFMFATLVVLAALAVLYYGITWLLTKVATRVY